MTEPPKESLETRERAASSSRHWVRLTACCNNRCRFCLDTDAQDGRSRSVDEVLSDIARGVALGRRRLVLSGGEPTIHPELLRFIAAGAAAGYERVQVITNGRMFARGELLDAAVRAGLGEVTISVHGHTAALHDHLVGVPGAFAQTLRGLRNALAHSELVVNVDVVVCRQNVEVIDQIIALCQRLGVHEFDLLQVQPAGRAATGDVLYDVDDHGEALRRTLSLSRRPELFLWTNRFPVTHLEGFEELIQDPHKLVDEVRGRFEHFEALLTRGEALPCRDDRCRACFLQPLCDELHLYARRLGSGEHREALVDLRRGPPPSLPRAAARGVETVRLLARDLDQARSQTERTGLPGRSLTLWLDDARGLEAVTSLEALRPGGLPVERLASGDASVLEAGLSLGVAELEVAPSRANQGWLAEHRGLERPRLVVRPAPRESASECLSRDIPPAELAALLSTSTAQVEDLPRCLSGWREADEAEGAIWTETELQGELAGAIELAGLERFVERFAATRYRGRSPRCADCREAPRCRGQHIQRLRAFGLSTLGPRG